MNKERIWPAYDVEACDQLDLNFDDYTITVLGLLDVEVIDTIDVQSSILEGDLSLWHESDIKDLLDAHVKRAILPRGLAYVELSRFDDRDRPRIAAVVDLKGVSNRETPH